MIRRTRALYDIVREISLDDIRDEASRHFSIVVTGPSAPARAELLGMLSDGTTEPGSPLADHSAQDGYSPLFERASIVLYALPSGQVAPLDVALLRRIAPIGLPVLVVAKGAPALVGEGHALDDLDALVRTERFRLRLLRLPSELGGAKEQLIRAVLRELEAFDLALARRLPPFRPPVAAQLINETARANAEFALMSNIPALVPVVGNLVTAGADLFVLTKNQMMLVFKIAAAYGQEMKSSRSLLAEMAPVVGASFFWRTLARELAALLPAGIGAIPKTTIAYTGTFVAGRSAQYYYSTGRKPNPDLVTAFYKEALDRVRGLVMRRDGEKGEDGRR